MRREFTFSSRARVPCTTSSIRARSDAQPTASWRERAEMGLSRGDTELPRARKAGSRKAEDSRGDTASTACTKKQKERSRGDHGDRKEESNKHCGTISGIRREPEARRRPADAGRGVVGEWTRHALCAGADPPQRRIGQQPVPGASPRLCPRRIRRVAVRNFVGKVGRRKNGGSRGALTTLAPLSSISFQAAPGFQ